jgi:glycosyltransferase involved in cell wall biosynthesis
MKITHILPGFGHIPRQPEVAAYGGITMTALRLAEGQASLHQNVSVLGLTRESNPFRTTYRGIHLHGIRPLRLLRNRRYDLRYLGPAFLACARERVDILHCYSNPMLLYLPGRHRILHLENLPAFTDPASYSGALARADAIICCSGFVRNALLESFPHVADRTWTVHNGGDQYADPPKTLRRQLGLSNSDFVLLFVGAITPEKGLHVLLDALAQLVDTSPGIRLLVVGASNLWHSVGGSGSVSEYERRIRDQATSLPVHFLGKLGRDRMAAAYGAADIFVCPSTWEEPFGIVNVEAMSAGLPVIASQVGGIPEILNDTVGRLVPTADATRLAETIVELLEDQAMYYCLSTNAIQRAKLFTWDRTQRAIAQIYGQVTECQTRSR